MCKLSNIDKQIVWEGGGGGMSSIMLVRCIGCGT